MTADTTRREHSGSGIRLGIGSCPGIAKILPAGIRGITLPDGTRVVFRQINLRVVTS